MLPGPVFHVELLTTARRARYYVLRFVYGMILLLLIWELDPAWRYTAGPGGAVELSIADMADLGRSICWTYSIAQAIAVLFLTPAMVAGVIADERQRKTLHYLLASRLTSAEMVLGKLMARLLHLFVLVTLGVPIMSLISLFGGVSFALVLLVYAATCSTIFFLAALSVLVSTHARRPREAISLVYILELAWLFLPTMIEVVLPRAGSPWTEIYAWIRPINHPIAESSPFALFLHVARAFGRLTGLVDAAVWMIGLQAAAGAVMVLWAVLRLRPVFRKSGEQSRWLARTGAGRWGKRILPRPSCGNDAMLWKERYVSRTTIATKVVGGLIVVAASIALFYSTFQVARPAFVDLMQNGYAGAESSLARDDLNGYLRAMQTVIYILWILAIASTAASSITSEREEDTWASLTTAPLDGWQIIRAKMFGAVWATRWLGVILALLWATGLAAGSIHPFGLAAVAVELVVFLWFATALGVYCSLTSRNSSRAMTSTVAVLVFLNGGYLLAFIPHWFQTQLIYVGVTPFVQYVSLFRFGELASLQAIEHERGVLLRPHTLTACLVSVLIYGAAVAGLTCRMAFAFDRIIGRPRWSAERPAGLPAEARSSVDRRSRVQGRDNGREPDDSRHSIHAGR